MATLPLKGIRVLDLSQIYAGPLCTKILADMGAEVIKIESLQRPDIARRLCPAENEPGEDWFNRGGYTAKRAINKYGITLNLTDPKGVAIFKRLVEISDVVVENFAPRVMKNFGLDYPVLKEINPRIIMIPLSGYGQTGPWGNWGAFGYVLEYAGGVTTITGYEDTPPRKIGLSYTDPWSGVLGAGAIIMALRQRNKTGRGQFIDLSQRDVATAFIGEAIMDYVMNGRVWGCIGNRHPSMAPHGCYRCKGEEDWVVIAVSSDEEWKCFCDAIGNPPWTKDEKFATVLGRMENQDELDRLIEEWTRERDHYEAMHTLQQAGVAAGAVLKNKEFFFDPHLKERDFYRVVDHDVVGKRVYPRITTAKFSQWPEAGEPYMTAPTVGRDNERILVGLLGISREELAQLEEEKVTGTKIVDPMALVPPELSRSIFQKQREVSLRIGGSVGVDEDYMEQLGLK